MRTFFRYLIRCTKNGNDKTERFLPIADSEEKAIQKALKAGYTEIERIEPFKDVYVVVKSIIYGDVRICKNEQELHDFLSTLYKEDSDAVKYHCVPDRLEDYFLCEHVHYLEHETQRVEFIIK